MKKKRKITGPDVGIIISIVGIIASIIVIIMNVMNGESVTVGIGLLCYCSVTLSVNVRNKKEEDNK